jgi:hypothetical protein
MWFLRDAGTAQKCRIVLRGKDYEAEKEGKTVGLFPELERAASRRRAA